MSVLRDEVLADAVHAAFKPSWRGYAHLCRSTRFAVAEYPRIRSVASSTDMQNQQLKLNAVQPALEQIGASTSISPQKDIPRPPFPTDGWHGRDATSGAFRSQMGTRREGATPVAQ